MAFYEVTKLFRVKVDGNVIELREGQIVSIPEEKATKLLSDGKIRPATKDEHFSNAFQRAVGEMSSKYKDGFFDYARSRSTKEYERFNQSENRINQYWDVGSFEGFAKELAEWKDIYADLLKLFKSEAD